MICYPIKITSWILIVRYNDNGLVPPNCTKLLGPKYALLRPEFIGACRNLKPRTGEVKKVFIFFGDVDPDNLTGRALEAMSISEF